MIARVLQILSARPAVVWLATIVLCVLGVGFARTMPSGIYPEVEFPRVVVVAKEGGAPAEVFVTSITRPLEQALATVLGVERIRSKTIRGATEINLQFSSDTDMWRALQLVESRVNEMRPSLPPTTEIVVEQITTGSFPVVTFNLSGPIDPRELREVGDFVVRPAFSSVPGVGRVEILGGDVREIEIVLDPKEASALHLTPDGIATQLRTAMGLSAVGRVERDRQMVTVISDAQPNHVEDIREMPIAVTPEGITVPLGSVAEVIEGAQDRWVRIGGPRGSTVVLSVARMPGASTTEVVRGVEDAARSLAPTLPPGVTLVPVYDQARLVNESVASVRDAIVIGIALCMLVIGVFLRDVRAGLLAGLAVPVTLAITFFTMKLAHQTLNLMSLGGMAVSIGLVVDDAIVIVESIARERERGLDAKEAALRGTAALAPAVIGTTLTTIVVFVPLAFLGGVVGDFFRSLAFTLTSAVSVSLVVALLLVPLAAGRFLKSQATEAKDVWARAYGRIGPRLVAKPIIAFVALAFSLVLGAVLVPGMQRGFLPEIDEGAFVLDYFLPAGTSLETTESFARALEKELAETPEVRTFSRRLGAELGPAAATELDRGDIMVSLTDQRKRSSAEIVADLRARIEEKYPEIRIEFVQVLQDVINDLAGDPHPLEVKIFGPDYAKLHEIGEEVGKRIEHVPGLVDLYTGHEAPTPELDLVLARDEIARLGLTPDEVTTRIDAAMFGAQVGAVPRFDRLVSARVRYPNPIRFDPERVIEMPVVVKDRVTTLDAVVDAKVKTSQPFLLHEGLQPVMIVSGANEGRDIGSIADEVDKNTRGIEVPVGYRMVMGGQAESQRATTRDLLVVAGMAMLLVLAVLAAQFKRLRVALLVLVTIPVAIVGALLALRITFTPINASSMMGCVLLVGLVVKNGVLLLEEAEHARDRGDSADQAVLVATDRRLRPVMMTTLATLAGLFPLALGFGAGSEIQRPLAIAVMGGLVTSTLATLVILPSFAARALK